MITKLYGQHSGLKFKDLNTFKPLCEQAGARVIESLVIGVNYFDNFVKENGLNPQSTFEQASISNITTELSTINKEILTSLPKERPLALAIRSSEISEGGGSGIFGTEFLVLHDTSNAEELLWQAELKVYLSEWSPDAQAFRQKHNQPMGMEIMIQILQGRNFGNYFAPFLAGSAYTSYNGQALIRITFGLGTRAVNSDATVIQGNGLLKDWSVSLLKTQTIDALNLNGATNGFEQISLPNDWKKFLTAEPILELQRILNYLRQKGDFYIEWCMSDYFGSDLTILQIAPFEDKETKSLNIESTPGKELCSGTDIVNHGEKECQIIVLIDNWHSENRSWQQMVNKRLSNYVLILPQTAFTSMSRELTVSYADFSNASVLIESQHTNSPVEESLLRQQGISVIDHTENRGGMHFQQVCSREDILFLGGFLRRELFAKHEPFLSYNRGGVKIYKVPTKTINDTTCTKGTIYMTGGFLSAPKYSFEDINRFAEILYDTASSIEREASADGSDLIKNLVNSFYTIHFAIFNDDLINFDPFKINWDTAEVNPVDLISYINLVIENAEIYAKADSEELIREGGLIDYLTELKTKISI